VPLTAKINRYFHTLRYLKPEQILWRIWYKVYRPKPDLRPAPDNRPISGKWVKPAAKPVSIIAANRCRFLNQEKSIATSNCWNDPASDKLWLYNLHYFDDPNAKNAEDRLEWHRNLIHRWINENPPGKGAGWEP
jgi:hypothetical protein